MYYHFFLMQNICNENKNKTHLVCLAHHSHIIIISACKNKIATLNRKFSTPQQQYLHVIDGRGNNQKKTS